MKSAKTNKGNQRVVESSSDKKMGGNKNIHTGPLGGKYVIVLCDGKRVKKYLKKKH